MSRFTRFKEFAKKYVENLDNYGTICIVPGAIIGTGCGAYKGCKMFEEAYSKSVIGKEHLYDDYDPVTGDSEQRLIYNISPLDIFGDIVIPISFAPGGMILGGAIGHMAPMIGPILLLSAIPTIIPCMLYKKYLIDKEAKKFEVSELK
jgi:hypothetical protein